MKFVTVINKYTRKPVPFRYLPNGEIQIISTDPRNNEDTCIVTATIKFYEYSLDYMETASG